MFCNKCGKEFEGQGILCPECTAEATPVNNESVPPVPVPEETPVTQENQQATPVPQPETVESTEEPFVLGTPEKPAKKKRSKKIIAICAAVALLLGGIGFFVFFTDAGRYLTSSPEEYLQDAQQEQLTPYVNGASAAYGMLMETPEPGSLQTNVQIKADDALFDLLGTMGMATDDYQWLRDINYTMDTVYTKDGAQHSIDWNLGSTHITKADIILDTQSGKAYIGLPEQQDTYLYSEIPASDLSDIQQFQTAMEVLRKDMPDAGTMRKLLDSYLELALDQVTDVTKAEENVLVNGVTEKQHVLTATIKSADILEIFKVALEKAQTDEEIKDIINALNTFANIMGEGGDLYSEFTAEVPRLIGELASEIAKASPADFVILKTYINHSGEITGRILTVYNSNGPSEEVLRCLSVNANGVTQMQGNIGKIFYTGSSQTVGEVTTTTCTYTQNEEELYRLETIVTEDTSVEYRMTPGKTMLRAVMSSFIPYSAAEMASSMAAGAVTLSVTIMKPEDEQLSASANVQYNGKTLITLDVTCKKTGEKSLGIPGNTTDSNNASMQQWLKDFDWETLRGRLQTAGVPEKFINQLEQKFNLG